MEKTPVYLIMTTAENNNKYYNCFPNSDGTFTVKYGRVGGHESTTTYPMSKWDSQINSKLKKGYVSQTHLMTDVIENSKEEEPTEGKDKFSVIENKSVRDIIKRLYDFANKVVQSAYKVKSSVVTQAMIDEAQSLIDNLALNYENKIRYLAMPRVGCGHGHLDWDVVKEAILDEFDNYFDEMDEEEYRPFITFCYQ